MMIKKIAILMMVFALLPIATAFTDGQILTQQEVDNFPIENYNTIDSLVNLLECQREGNGFNTYRKDKWYYVKPFSCLQLDVINYGESYEIIRKTFYPKFRHQNFYRCLQTLDDSISLRDRISICYDIFQENLRTSGKLKIFGIKAEIESYQGVENTERDFGTDFGGGYW